MTKISTALSCPRIVALAIPAKRAIIIMALVLWASSRRERERKALARRVEKSWR